MNSKNVSVMIQARVGSKRFPQKVLAKIENKPMIWHVINRIKSIKTVHQTILLTTKRTEDKILLKIANDSGAIGFAGHTHDVLKRYYECAKKHDVDMIVRITGDCPLIDPDLVRRMMMFYSRNNLDYLSNILIPTFPDGLDTEIFSFKTLEIMNKNAKLPSEREHVTAYIRNNINKFKTFNLENSKNLSDLRWTVDEPCDLQFVRRIYSQMRPELIFSMKDVLSIISKNPKIADINQGIIRNEGYLISLEKDKKKAKH